MDKFTFGKYKGEYVDNIIDTNPDYVRWCLANVSYFTLDEEQQKRLREQPTWLDRQLSRIYSDNCDDYEEEPWDGYEADMRGCFDPNY